MPNPDPQSDPPRPPNLWQTLLSVFSAFIGVQSSKNRKRDFTSGKAGHFIILGVLFTIAFVLIVITVVKIVLKNAGL